MRPQDVIRKKRDGLSLSREEIEFFISGVTSGRIADYQVSALLMAIYLNGMAPEEQQILTEAMLNSGNILDFSDIPKPKADKHSTGGVGDKTSIIIAPLVAACGVCVPMISGRGLGHTGGTLDKLESIPGYSVNLSATEFKTVLQDVGYAMAGQTAELAPADKKMYALRDATSTVEAIPAPTCRLHPQGTARRRAGTQCRSAVKRRPAQSDQFDAPVSCGNNCSARARSRSRATAASMRASSGANPEAERSDANSGDTRR